MNAPTDQVRLESLPSAMAKAFAMIDGAVKDSTNPHFKNRYADLSAVIDAIKPALVANGLWYTHLMHESDHGVTVETVVYHVSGESMSFGKLFMPATKTDAQGYGSALTYARRYSLATAFGLRTFDDDAEAARAAQERKPPSVDSSQVLAKLRTASLDGIKSLQEAHGKLKGLPGFNEVWKEHAESLKAAAAQVQE